MQNTQKPKIPKRGRKKATMYHNAAFNAFSKLLDEGIKSGSVELEHEHQLSKHALRIDFIIKKGRDFDIKRVWGKFMRGHNIIEYKSPVVPLPTLEIFDKVVHGYAGIYASQEGIKLIDMTVTIVCSEKPEVLLKTLEDEFDYEILRECEGIYYIRQKGVAVEKTLAIQVVVCSELPDSEILLKALRPGIDADTAKAVTNIISADVADELELWTEVVFTENLNTLLKEGEKMKKSEQIQKLLKEYGYLRKEEELRQECLQEGRQEVFALLESGYSLDDAKKKLQLV